MSSSEIINFGCRLNAYESQAIKQMLAKNNLQDAIVFNTCAVTKEAEKQARQQIRKLKRENPDKKIIVTGCAAQVNSAQFEAMPEVDRIVGNSLKHDIESYILIDNIKVKTRDIMQDKKVAENEIVTNFEDKTRAFLQVQNGCDHRCTFCIIPFGRGNSRSVEPRRVINEVRTMIQNGYKEVVLTGVDTTSYGNDFENPIKLGELCKIILEEFSELPRLRLSSIDVAEIDDDIVDLIANEKRFMPYLHISAQSGDNLILKRMKRRHTREMLIDFCNKMRKLRPEIAFGSDIIAGFPTENDEMFANTQDMMAQTGMVYNHVFSYSQRDGTPAARMPQVDYNIRKTRTKQLIDQTNKQLNYFLQTMIGTTQKVLCEYGNTGRCENFAPVKIVGEYTQGQIVEYKILGINNNMLIV